ncbi:MAG: hypothetical protein ACOCU5_03510 [Bacillota bacterium]
MRVIHAFKDLMIHYRTIMPTYLVATILMVVLSNAFPGLGTIVFLPFSVGVAFVMLRAIVFKAYRKTRALSLGFRRSYYLRNVFYLVISQIAYLVPLAVGAVISGWFLGLYGGVNTRYGAAAVNLVFFSIPSVAVSLMFAMVPYLLADPKFDQRKYSPLRVSARIMKGHYGRLLFMRIFFAPWLALNASSLAVAFTSLYTRVLGVEGLDSDWLLPSFMITPVLYLVFLPWYRMVHAELYAILRDKVKGYAS